MGHVLMRQPVVTQPMGLSHAAVFLWVNSPTGYHGDCQYPGQTSIDSPPERKLYGIPGKKFFSLSFSFLDWLCSGLSNLIHLTAFFCLDFTLIQKMGKERCAGSQAKIAVKKSYVPGKC